MIRRRVRRASRRAGSPRTQRPAVRATVGARWRCWVRGCAALAVVDDDTAAPSAPWQSAQPARSEQVAAALDDRGTVLVGDGATATSIGARACARRLGADTKRHDGAGASSSAPIAGRLTTSSCGSPSVVQQSPAIGPTLLRYSALEGRAAPDKPDPGPRPPAVASASGRPKPSFETGRRGAPSPARPRPRGCAGRPA